MALVTLQRSPSPSNDPEEVPSEGDDLVDGRHVQRHKRAKSKLEKLRKIISTVRFISKLRPCLSESYFTIKGAALILPHSDLARKTSKRNHGGDIQRHLQAMLYLLRPEDKIKVAIKLEGTREGVHRYMALVCTIGRQDTEESVILGMDCIATQVDLAPSPSSVESHTQPTTPSTPTTHHPSGGATWGSTGYTASVGMVLPIWMGMKVRLSGDGGFSISIDEKSFIFRPVSVQAMWSAIQSLEKALHQAEQMKYLAEGLTHTWVEYYHSKVDVSNLAQLSSWNLMEDVEIFAPSSLSFSEKNEIEKVKLIISCELKKVMMSVDLDEATSLSLRTEVERSLNMKLDQYRSFFDEEMIRILGQMDSPSKILDYLFLGSEWNASNLEELQSLGIKYILNVTREIDNFFIGMFHYYNVRLYDQEDSELLKYWLNKTHRFINRAKKHGSKVLVHCKMGISRSASTVIAYLMKENNWSLETAYDFVKKRRNCVHPNKGFMTQLETYEGILCASNKRKFFGTQSDSNAGDEDDGDDMPGDVQQGDFLGADLYQGISCSEWQGQREEEFLKGDYGGDQDFNAMEPDFETDSRSADSMEESLPDVPSPTHEGRDRFSLPTVTLELDLGNLTSGRSSVDKQQVPRIVLCETKYSVGDVPTIPRIKPDSSWIKLEVPGESSTDPVTQETMEITDTEPESESYQQASSLMYSVDPLPGISSSPDNVSEPLAAVENYSSSPSECKIVIDAESECNEGLVMMSTDLQARGHKLSDGVHQYYSKEQIPWRPGKVRNLRLGVFRDATQMGEVVRKCDSKSVDSGTESDPALLDSLTAAKGSPPMISHCMSCVEFSTPEEFVLGGEEQGCRPKSLYEREEIPLRPGTVQRTRQEIEERQKWISTPHRLYGNDCEYTTQSTRSVHRSSSLKEKQKNDPHSHQNERRKTCTPILSPSSKPLAEGVGQQRSSVPECEVVKLDFQIGESSTDDADMEIGEEAIDQGRIESDQNVRFMVGAEEVPVTVGMVRRQKKEIESKSSEGCMSHRRTLSGESTSSCDSGENTTGYWSPTYQTGRNRCGSEHFSSSVISQTENLHSDTTSPVFSSCLTSGLPTATMERPQLEGGLLEMKPPWSAEEVVPGQSSLQEQSCVILKESSSMDGVKFNSGFSVTTGLIPCDVLNELPFSATQQKETKPSTWLPSSEQKCRVSETLETDLENPKGMQSVGKSGSSTLKIKKQHGKCNIDPKTLAMIREIGSAFVNTPPKSEVSEGQFTSLVKHLVKNIEKDARPERKIILIDKGNSNAVGMSRRQSKDSEVSFPKPVEGLDACGIIQPSVPCFVGTRRRCDSDPSTQLSMRLTTSEVGCQEVAALLSSGVSVGELGVTGTPTSCPRILGASRAWHSGDQPPSVVRHLVGRFETPSQHELLRKDEDGEIKEVGSTALFSPSAQSHGDVTGNLSVLLKEHGAKQYESQPITRSHSFTQPSSGKISGIQIFPSLAEAENIHRSSSASITLTTSRRPRSAEHSSRTDSLFAGQNPSSGPASTDTEDEGNDEMGEYRKVRQLHGKSHPLSKLMQRQNRGPFYSAAPRQGASPFHSST